VYSSLFRPERERALKTKALLSGTAQKILWTAEVGLANRWRIARPTVYDRLRQARVKVLDFNPRGGRGRKLIPFGAVLEVENRQLRAL
jgi:hypothetical protein